MATQSSSTIPEMAQLCKYRLTLSVSQHFTFMTMLEKKYEGFTATVKLNLHDHLIITPKDEFTDNILTGLIDGNKHTQRSWTLEKLNPEDKPTKVVLLHYPLPYTLEAITKLTYVTNAVRCTMGREKTPTKSVIVTVKGTPPSTIDLGCWGTYKTRLYKPEPLRCFKCNKFGHHQARCTARERCGVCSGPHTTSTCLEKHQQGNTTTACCPNCHGAHHAWYPRCPTRLHIVNPTRTTTPAPIPSSSAWATGPPNWTRKEEPTSITLTSQKLVELLTKVVEIATSATAEPRKIIEEAVATIMQEREEEKEDWPALSRHQRIPKKTLPPRNTPRKKITLDAPINKVTTQPTKPTNITEINTTKEEDDTDDSSTEVEVEATSPPPPNTEEKDKQEWMPVRNKRKKRSHSLPKR